MAKMQRIRAIVVMSPTGVAHLADGPTGVGTLCGHQGGEDKGWHVRSDLLWWTHRKRCRDCIEAYG
jgi:hypothetical protein